MIGSGTGVRVCLAAGVTHMFAIDEIRQPSDATHGTAPWSYNRLARS